MHNQLENIMLYNKQGQQVNFPVNHLLSDATRRTLTEKLEPLPHKGHKMFRLEVRAVMK